MKLFIICACTAKRDPNCTAHHVHRMDTGEVLSSYSTMEDAIAVAAERQGNRIKNGWHHHYGTSHPSTRPINLSSYTTA